MQYIDDVMQNFAKRVALIAWQIETPSGFAGLRSLAGDRGSLMQGKECTAKDEKSTKGGVRPVVR